MRGVERLRLIVARLTVGLWFCLILVQVALPQRPVPPQVHVLMMMVAGFLFGPSIVGRRDRDRADDE